MFKLIPCTVVAAVLGGFLATLPAQNVTLVKQWKRSGATFFNDCWGYTGTDGREYAVVGESRGIWLLETTGGVVKQLKWWSAPSSSWRSFTNVGPYIYVGTENRSQRGFRVIDLSKSGAPVDVGYVQTSTLTSAHDVAGDPDAGFIYFTGSNQGVAIYDVKTTPKNPKFVAKWTTNYVHDACVRRGKAYFASGRSYACKILNVSNVTKIKYIGQANTPGGYSHNAWISEDDKLLCCTDEISRNGVTPHMTVWDVTNPASPKKTGDYDNGSKFIAHNVYVIGRTAYMSHYIDGMHVIDLADPTKPTRIARYDTSTVSSGYNGCWGCYPFADSGLIYASDMQKGLFVLQVDCGHMNRYGAGTPGTKGLPRVRFDGASPKVAASKMRLECEKLEPNKHFWVVVGTGAGSSTVLGAKINVNLGPATIIGPFTANAKGEASVNAPVPNNAGLGGAKIYLQVVGDRGNGTLISSRGMWAGICK